MAQGKLVRVASGVIWDVVVDVRRSSSSFGRWFAVELSADNRKQLWVPVGFAHGFLAMSDDVVVVYKTSAPYSPEHERSVRWNDPELAIEWPSTGVEPVLSSRDATAPLLRDVEVFES
jgi:dTDP-4-dehydrorhamnose 3,5-epimerase